MKRVIVQIEFVEDEETRTKPMMEQNLLVCPNQDGGYTFFYHSGSELNKLKLKSAKLVEVKIIDNEPELILEKK